MSSQVTVDFFKFVFFRFMQRANAIPVDMLITADAESPLPVETKTFAEPPNKRKVRSQKKIHDADQEELAGLEFWNCFGIADRI